MQTNTLFELRIYVCFTYSSECWTKSGTPGTHEKMPFEIILGDPTCKKAENSKSSKFFAGDHLTDYVTFGTVKIEFLVRVNIGMVM